MEEQIQEPYGELKNQLDNFIEGNQYGAFLIDGKWGSGKTYFVKKYIEERDIVKRVNNLLFEYENELEKKEKQLKDANKRKEATGNSDVETGIKELEDEIAELKVKIEDQKTVKKNIQQHKILRSKAKKGENNPNADEALKMYIYVSLDGVSKTEDIARMMFSEIHTRVSKVMNSKGMKVIRKIVSACSLNVGHEAFSLGIDPAKIFENIDFSNYIESNNITKYVIFLDDVERCKIEISELLGFINSFIEEKDIKIVLIAKEKEIANSIYSNEKNIHFLGATILSCFQKKNNSNNESEDEIDDDDVSNLPYADEVKKEDDKKLELIDVKKTYEDISSNFSVYSIIKEKFISSTYHFETDLEYVVDNMISGIAYKNKEMVSRIVAIVKSLKIENLRILSIAIDKIKSFYRLNISNVSNKLYGNVELDFILSVYILQLPIDYQNAKKLYNYYFDNSEKDISKKLKIDKKIINILKNSRLEYDDYYCIDSIFEYTYSGKNIENIIQDLLNLKIEDPYMEKIYSYWDTSFKSAAELTKSFEKVLTSFGKNNLDDMVKIFYRYSEYIYKYNFSDIKGNTLNMKYKEIINKINNTPETIEKIDYYITTCCDEVIDKMKSIKELSENGVCSKMLDKLFSDLKTNDKLDFDNYRKITRKNYGFLSKFDIKKIKEEIKKLSIPEISRFTMVCQNIYWGEDYPAVYKDDFNSINQLIEFLESECKKKGFDKLRKKNYEILVGALKYCRNEITYINE